MADLITHGCTALLWRAWRPREHTPSFVAGSLLPDLLARVPSIGFTRLHDGLGWPIPDGLIYGFGPLHLPIGMALSSYLLSLLFPAPERRGIWAALFKGSLLHLAVDLLQDHYGAGYTLLYPCSMWDWEAGWLGSEATVVLAPPLVVLTALVWRRRARPSSPTASASPPAEGEDVAQPQAAGSQDSDQPPLPG